jgi:hypothetical protein
MATNRASFNSHGIPMTRSYKATPDDAFPRLFSPVYSSRDGMDAEIRAPRASRQDGPNKK